MINTCLFGDCRDNLKIIADAGIKAQMCVTSPPYYGLRDYGHEKQLGLESTPEEYINNMIDVFQAVRNVLANDGTLWLNLGDSYGKRKQLLGIPWKVAFALQANGWTLRQDIIWHKPNPMPESVKDRCTKAHEYVFLLSKSERYFFDSEAMKEPISDHSRAGKMAGGKGRKNDDFKNAHGDCHRGGLGGFVTETRNRRSVWAVATRPYKGAHFATFPPALIEPCILAGSRHGDIVLDPFFGSGTTGQVAQRLNRNWIGCEINSDYNILINSRLK